MCNGVTSGRISSDSVGGEYENIAEKSYGVLNLVKAMLVFMYTRELMNIFVEALFKYDKNQEKEEESR